MQHQTMPDYDADCYVGCGECVCVGAFVHIVCVCVCVQTVVDGDVCGGVVDNNGGNVVGVGADANDATRMAAAIVNFILLLFFCCNNN